MSERYLIPKEQQDAYDGMSDAERQAARQSRSGRRHRAGQSKGRAAFTSEAVSHRLITQIAERFAERPGGYTRIIRLSRARIGDAGSQAILQLVGDEQVPGNIPKAAKSARDRRINARYAAVMKVGRPAKSAGPAGADESPSGSGGGGPATM
jgi:ribosomal protein L17